MTKRMTVRPCSVAWPNRRMVAAFIASVPFFAAIPGAAQVLPSVARPVAIDIRSEPITAFDIRDPSRRRFGLLEFRGGLVLRSAHSSFGGISAIRVAADGTQFIALTDRGWWFRGRLLYEGTRPSGIADAEMAPCWVPTGSRWPRGVGTTRSRSRRTVARFM